jgi:glycosyltransferase involved in cell wall biosynthesis
MSIPQEKIIVIPNGVDHSKFYSIPQTSARKELRLPVDKKIVLSVGNLTPNKGFDILIKSLKVLVEDSRDQDIVLVIVGEGDYRKVLVELVLSLNLDEHVLFVGSVRHEQLYLWYNAANCFCLASEREGWPNVVMESLACGTPIVATSVGGIPEILSRNSTGILTDRSVNDISNKLGRALQSSWNPDEIVKYAKQYTWNRSARSVLQVFESVLHKHSPNPYGRKISAAQPPS